MGLIDLHTHSSASDGQYTPSALISLAEQKGLSAIALTDHDTVDGLKEAADAAKARNIRFINGIEISVRDEDVRELHILGYCIDTEKEPLVSMCKRLKMERSVREEKIFEFLARNGVILTRESVDKQSRGGIVARPHFARAMVEAGFVSTTREAFDKYLATPDFYKIERPKPSPEEGIRCILDAGGVAVLAHPIQTKLDIPQLAKLLGKLKEMGLSGLECHYSTHTPQQTREYLALAKRLDLTVTGGSDFHGELVKPEIALGSGINGSLHIEDAEILHR